MAIGITESAYRQGTALFKGGSERVEMVDQLAEPAGAAPVEAEHEPRQFPEARLIELFIQWAAQRKLSLHQEIAEPFLNSVELFSGDADF